MPARGSKGFALKLCTTRDNGGDTAAGVGLTVLGRHSSIDTASSYSARMVESLPKLRSMVLDTTSHRTFCRCELPVITESGSSGRLAQYQVRWSLFASLQDAAL